MRRQRRQKSPIHREQPARDPEGQQADERVDRQPDAECCRGADRASRRRGGDPARSAARQVKSSQMTIATNSTLAAWTSARVGVLPRLGGEREGRAGDAGGGGAQRRGCAR